MRDKSLEILAPQAGQRILDVGCGPAYYLSDMPEVDYHGFDTDAGYIAHAKKRFGSRGKFYCEIFTAEHAAQMGKFDCVMLMGLLHHLDDRECRELLALTAQVLAPGGLVVALDTVVHEGQNKLERLLAEGDRGEHVREPDAFMDLAREHFSKVEGALASDWWVPSIYWTMSMRSPKKNASPQE